jgi:hypothetical protein
MKSHAAIKRGQLERMRSGNLLGHLDPLAVRQMYIDEALSISELARAIGCGVSYARNYLNAFGIYRDRGHMVRAGTAKVWNDGLTKQTDQRLARLSRLHSGDGNPSANKPAWNVGLKAADHPSIVAIANARRGSKHNTKTREKMAAHKRGQRGAASNAWKGGHLVGGYIQTGGGRNRRYLHREIAVELLKRPLLPGEQVHHVDQDRAHNNPSNLLVLHTTPHTQLHAAMRRSPGLDQRQWLRDRQIPFEDLIAYAKD